MRFTHGSSQNIEGNDFDVFDYTISNDNTIDNDCIDNGNDGEGIGVYAFIGDTEIAIAGAGHYTSEKSAYAYILDVNIEPEDLMNNREPDEIPAEEIGEAIQSFIDDLRDQKGYNKESCENVVNSFYDNFDGLEISTVNEELKNQGLNVVFDEWAEPSEYEDFNDWKAQTEEQYDMQEPCSAICEEGSPESLAQDAIDQADNLWDTIKYLGRNIAVHSTQKGIERYNKTFQKAITETLRDHNLVATLVCNDEFAVIFDTDEIDLVKKIDINAKLKEDLKEDKQKRKRRSRPS